MTKQVQLSTNNETLINQNTQLSQTFEELDSKEGNQNTNNQQKRHNFVLQ
jgi:predicted RND superfamily exporter protein